MKRTIPLVKRAGASGSTIALALVFGASLAIAPLTSAKGKPGGGGGGEDPPDPGITINPVPDLVDPPIGYTETEIVWNGDDNGDGILDVDEVGWEGITFNGINNQGLVAAFVGLPPRDESGQSWRLGAINLDPVTGAVTDELTDLDEIFAAALTALNTSRADGPWRIAYGRSVNDMGLVALQLIPESAPILIHDGTCLLAVGDLSRRSDPDAVMAIPLNTNGFNDHFRLTAAGSALVRERQPDGSELIRVFPLAEKPNGEVGYFLEYEMPVPPVDGYAFPGIKDSDAGEFFPEFVYRRTVYPNGSGYIFQVVKYTYSCDFDQAGNRLNEAAEETILQELENVPFVNAGFGTSGTTYGNIRWSETIGKGKNAQTISGWIPYHFVNPTEWTPLAAPGVSAELPEGMWSVSDAQFPGEEEVVIEFVDTGEVALFKPNFGARFLLPITPGIDRYVLLSSPVDPAGITTGAADYAAGYVGYGTDAEPDRAFVLTPDGAPVPGAVLGE